MSARLTGWHKLKDFHEEDAYYLEGAFTIPVHGEVIQDIRKQAILAQRAELAEAVKSATRFGSGLDDYDEWQIEVQPDGDYLKFATVLALIEGSKG